ncbi:MAG TPA: hypothetical protein PKC55_12105 [Dysgonomonas sp.]|uniref:hypothetical protein n=1 Tax=unclassified Dysgonomonas TaxID=2630389 RepID=UPI0025BA6F63|nr:MULTISPECIES: hypothetical protein [unclassified Dysgonomonas]HML65564.1 hypothetical protein [Dysgonomonas sp.]
MNNLLQSELCILLNATSLELTDKYQNAYVKFVEQLKSVNQPDKTYTTIYRMLSLTRIELQSLQIQPLYEQGEKCP